MNPTPCEARNWKVFSVCRVASSPQRSSRTFPTHVGSNRLRPQPHATVALLPVPVERPVPDTSYKWHQRYSHGMCGLPSLVSFSLRLFLKLIHTMVHRTVWCEPAPVILSPASGPVHRVVLFLSCFYEGCWGHLTLHNFGCFPFSSVDAQEQNSWVVL